MLADVGVEFEDVVCRFFGFGVGGGGRCAVALGVLEFAHCGGGVVVESCEEMELSRTFWWDEIF